MKELIKMWLLTLTLILITISLLAYGLYYCDFTVFLAGDLLGFPVSVMFYLGYRKVYYEHFNNERNF